MRTLSRSLRTAAATALAAALLWSAPAAAQGDPLWTYEPDEGFVDDPIAFSPDGKLLVYFHTDSATFTRMVLVSISDGFKTLKEINLGEATIVPRRVAFTPNSKRVVLIWMDGYKGTLAATTYDVATGKAGKTYGPAAHLALVKVNGKQVIALTSLKPLSKGGDWHQTVYIGTTDGQKVTSLKTKVLGDMTIEEPPVRVLSWEPGHFGILGLRPGKYDRAKDIRLPDVGLRYDLLKMKEVWGEAPKDLPSWELAIKMRQGHDSQLRYLEVSGDLNKLYYVDEKNSLTELQGKVPWAIYDHESLMQWESWDRQTLYFSLTVDPVNPAAVARKKEDTERVDIYALDRAGNLKLVGKVNTGREKGRAAVTKFGWSIGADKFAYLKKLKGFARGGKALLVYKTEQ